MENLCTQANRVHLSEHASSLSCPLYSLVLGMPVVYVTRMYQTAFYCCDKKIPEKQLRGGSFFQFTVSVHGFKACCEAEKSRWKDEVNEYGSIYDNQEGGRQRQDRAKDSKNKGREK